MFWRLSCHFCGKRSKYSTGTESFQCTQCEALNFFDSKGNVVDPPETIIYPAQQRFDAPPPSASFNRPTFRPSSPEAEQQTVCQRCLNNQQMYMNTLNNYLPDDLDEDDPKYREYIKKLPQMKAELEKRYPQVCKSCAPKVQQRIHQADYYGMSQHASGLVKQTRARSGRSVAGTRDDWSKRGMRLFLGLVNLVVYASLLYQVAWHAHGIFTTMFVLSRMDDPDPQVELVWMEPMLRGCVKGALRLHFEPLCFHYFGSFVPKALLTTFFLLWYNPGLKAWYHSTYRVEAVHGGVEYFRMQIILLIVRTVAWKKLSNLEYISQFSPQKIMAAHGFITALLVFGQRLSEKSITVDKWKIKGKIMPKPDEKDLFSETAGPGDERYSRQASSTHPLNLFARDERSFPIENLAPKSRQVRFSSKPDLLSMPPPSPPDTQSDSEDGDAMDIDPPVTRSASGLRNVISARSQTRSTNQNPGWGAMRNEVFGMQDQLRFESQRKRLQQEEQVKLRYEPPVERSPFRGRLPQAPMSMERKLRNPPTQLSFKQTPISKQQDFMKQMRDSFETGRTFDSSGGRKEGGKTSPRKGYDYENEDDDDFSPAKSRTRGGLELKPSTWSLPSDGMQMTGLEDAFGGNTFGIADAPVVVKDQPLEEPSTSFSWFWILVLVLTILPIAVWNIETIREPIRVWIIRKLGGVGHVDFSDLDALEA